MLHIIIIWALRLFGWLLIYVAVLMKEDEEGQWQNRLEQWSRAFGRRKIMAISASTAFMGGIAELTTHVFDSLFGNKLFSLRGVGVSVCYSVASILLCFEILSAINPHKFGSTSLHNWGWFLFFALLGSLPAIINSEKEPLWIWGLTLFAVIILPVLQVADAGYQKFGMARTAGGLLFIILMFGISFCFDILYIALTRWMLWKVSNQIHLLKMIGIVLLNIFLAVLITTGPFLLGLIEVVGAAKFKAPTVIGALGIALMFGTVLNFVDLLVCSVFLLLLVCVLLHRIFWPILERPIYACARFGVIKQKKLLWIAGIALMLAPGHGESIWNILQRL